MSAKIVNGNNVFLGEQITNINITKESDVLSVSLIENNCDFELFVEETDELALDASLPFVIYHNDTVAMVTYLDDYKRKGKNKWTVSTSDAIGRLDLFEFEGDVYFDKPATELLTEIFGKTDVEFVLNADLEGILMSGRIPYTTCREALAQVLFAVGCFAYTPDTLQSEKPCIYISPYNSISLFAFLEIPKSRVLSGTITSSRQKTTGVEVVEHDYEQNASISTTGGKWKWKGTPETALNGFALFEEPLYELHEGASAPSGGEIVRSSANFVEVLYGLRQYTGSAYTVLGKKYEHTTVINGKYSEAEENHIVAIENKTLVNSDNAQSILDRCFEYYTKPQELTAKIVEGKHVAEDGTITYDETVTVGDIVTVPTDYQGTYTGRIIKEKYNLNGNIVIKEITVK